MKIQKLSVIAGLVLGGLVATGNLAMAQDQKGGGQRRAPSVEQRMEKMTEDLKLTDEQKPKIKAILEESQKKREELRSDSSVPREDRREKMRGIIEKENKKLKEVLTADQYTKHEKMLEELRSSAKNRKKGQDGQEKKE